MANGLPVRSSQTLERLMVERGISQDEIERGLNYAVSAGATTTREAYNLAMSRILFSDEELTAGARFNGD
jgi:hypothetical protein